MAFLPLVIASISPASAPNGYAKSTVSRCHRPGRNRLGRVTSLPDQALSARIGPRPNDSRIVRGASANIIR